MANERVTLLDIAKMNGSDAVVGLIDECSKAHPEITKVPGRTIKGTHYKTLVRTALPTVGFRSANEGAAATKGRLENRLVETFILNPRWEQDKAVADVYEDGAQACIAIEASGQMEAALQHVSSQFYYGVANDAKGFPGLQAAVPSAMTLSAKGDTATACSSVYAVRLGPKAAQFVFGADGELKLSDVREESVTDENDNKFTAYVQEILAHMGLQVGSINAVARLCNVDFDHGVTDDLLAELFSAFPVGMGPNVVFMGKRALRQLKTSRTATSPTGAPAPTPNDYDGVPIFPTEALVDTEAVVA